MATFTLYAYLREDNQPSRVGIVAGRQFESHVRRHRAKRRLRAACRALWSRIAPGYDLVLVAHKPVLHAPFEQIQHQLIEAFTQLGVLKEGGVS